MAPIRDRSLIAGQRTKETGFTHGRNEKGRDGDILLANVISLAHCVIHAPLTAPEDPSPFNSGELLSGHGSSPINHVFMIITQFLY